MTPGLFMAMSLAVEIGGWASAQTSLQRSADVAAMAGAMNYLTTANNQTAATFGARMAQLNGGSGTASPTWSSGTNTLSDNMITASVINGYKSSSDTALQITVQKSIPATVSRAFTSTANYTISATSVAEIVTTTVAPTGAGGYQPCILTLSTSGQIYGTGSNTVYMPNCTMRSNGTIQFVGGSNGLTTKGYFAPSDPTFCSNTGSICIPSYFSPLVGTQYPTSAAVSDPYAGNTALQSAITTATNLTGVTNIACTSSGCSGLVGSSSCTGGGSNPVVCTLYPGNYGNFATQSGGPFTFNLQPGLYSFSGQISFSQTTTVTGSAVTIVAAGGMMAQGAFTFTATSPTVAQAATASPHSIPAVVFATKTSTAMPFYGATVFNPQGVVYAPNSALSFAGSSSSATAPATGSTSASYCLEIIAASLTLNGYSNFDSTSCATYGATQFYSLPSSTSTAAAMVH